jgi:hypothetical protein
MDEDVTLAVIGNEEAKAPRRVEPFDPTRTKLTFRENFLTQCHGFRAYLLSRFGTQTLHISSLPRTFVS